MSASAVLVLSACVAFAAPAVADPPSVVGTDTAGWRVNGAAVRYATTSTWRIPRSAKGRRITVTVTGTLTGYTSVARTSARTVRVAG